MDNRLPAGLRGRVNFGKGDDMDELISKRAVIEAIEKARANVGHNLERSIGKSIIEILDDVGRDVDRMPSALGTDLAEVGTDCISRRQAIDAVNGLIDRFEQILRDIREANVDDSVCGMCEYDGAYIGQSGDWCNECPGFDKDDCFKLSDKTRKKWTDEIIKALPPIQPEIIRCRECKFASGDSRICMKFDHSPIGELDFCAWAERRTDG